MRSKVAPETYTVEEISRLLGIGRNSAYDAVKAGLVPAIRFGKRIVIPKAAFDRFMETGAVR